MNTRKAKWAGVVVAMGLAGAPGLALAGEWFLCGNLGQLVNCQLPNFPVTRHEYGIALNTAQPQVVTCSTWNAGYRIYNRDPYFTYSDNPSVSSNWGGAMFYTGTNASDDDDCQSGTWRHRYWILGTNNVVNPSWSGGCINQPLWCRPY